MLWPVAFIVFVAIVALMQVAESKTMWGARRRKDDDDSDAGVKDFVYRKGPPEKKPGTAAKAAGKASINDRASKPKVVEQVTAKRIAKKQSADIAQNFQKVVDQLITVLDTMDLDNLDEFVNIDNMKQVFSAIPQIAEYAPHVQEVLESEEFQNPEVLRETIQKSLAMAREYLLQMKESLSDPEKVEELLNNMPPEALQLLNALKSGDFSSLASMIDDIPGVSEGQKSLFSKILSGNFDASEMNDLLSEAASEAQGQSNAMLDEMKAQLSSPDTIMKMREQLLENPALLQMMGISEEVLSDPDAFGAMVAEQMGQLESLFSADPEAATQAISAAAEAFSADSADLKPRRNNRRSRAA